ncbi:Mu transposase C-terminal domain-containing protein [Vibrio mangrovi]|uniref:DDE-type integrase/transposase/recombinase n=1 Tax=Vibrio mangrovi TaxID=474394 RepID=A0A1Y6IYP4_9VIBR|nr:Mu transposase C-terminal domain-containing protein [Vibrio mangrovi]MDW6002335.1 DDE-type integrase/transposase/recombinase [Vibrio mangrovi]SMS02767.1 Transposon Tn7 transposition protein TnsB [Vibrio mangrovi]
MGRRSSLSNAPTLSRGSSVFYEGFQYFILQIIDLSHVLAEKEASGEIKKLRISELNFEPDSKKVKSPAIDAMPDKDWQIAQSRLEIIRPLVGKSDRTKADVERVAEKHGFHINTLYKWLRLYEADNLLTSLTPNRRSDRGSTKLTPEVEAIISSCIEDEYLTKQKKSVVIVYTEVERLCRNADLSAPHINTVRNRIDSISRKLRISRRFGAQKAHRELHMNEGEFPHADFPLSVVQIDHTPLDIIIVDDEYRLPLDRPWLTMAIDIYSRMVVGFYISFDAPSETSVGSCLAHAILTKDTWLAEHDIDAEWPCWGLPRTVHADNAKEFRGKMLQKACDLYNINLEWRPVARPHFGGHIERLLGTFAKKIHALPGTTFSNIQERGEYDSCKESIFTLKEFEHWFANQIQIYHHDFHSSIGRSPISKYEEGILGSKTTKGVGLPARVKDEHALRLNFLPYVERTIQSYGIQIDKINYYHDVLRVWINSTVDGKSKLKRTFIFRRDPRNISVVWFFDPQLETYFPIPYRNNSFPAVSLWEVRTAKKKLKDDGMKTINEDVIFESIEKMREIEKSAAKKTKKARKSHQRRKVHEQRAFIGQIKPNEMTLSTSDTGSDDEVILPFDDIDEVIGHE